MDKVGGRMKSVEELERDLQNFVSSIKASEMAEYVYTEILRGKIEELKRVKIYTNQRLNEISAKNIEDRIKDLQSELEKGEGK